MESQPKISVIMPSLNVAGYIRQCMDSVLAQTLQDLEILCVDAGSTDGTLDILRDYEKKDARVKLILSEKKSYGYQMNLGLDAASGEYIGIIETDDWTEPEMFERLYLAAAEHEAEIVKSNFWWYTTAGGEKNVFIENLKSCTYDRLTDAYENDCALFKTTPSIWAGIFSLSMLKKKHIRFNETPGASYQDASFHFITCMTAEKVWLLRDAFLHYRKDNEASSMHSAGKIYAICDEEHYCEDYIESYADNKKKILSILMPVKFENYRWNYERIPRKFQWPFLQKIHGEFLKHEKEGVLVRERFSDDGWTYVQKLIREPLKYYLLTCKGDPVFDFLRNGYFKVKAIKK